MTDRQDYAGKYLKDYETFHYTFLERNLRWLDSLRTILVPSEAEQFADISFYQAGMDWDKYAKHARAVILRIGQNIWTDTEFQYNYTEAKRRKLAVGGYFFFDGRATPQQQANVIIQAMPGKAFEMELFIDWERNYGGASEGLPNVVKLMQLCEAAGIKCKAVGLYTGYYWFTANSNSITNAAEYIYLKQRPLWIAWYAAASVVKIPAPWETWTHWQHGTPVVDWGQPTAEIDMNKHNGTREQFTERYIGEIGGTMETWIIKEGVSLKVRSGPATTFAQIEGLAAGDKVEGVFDVPSGWIHISKIIRVNGTQKAVDGWCSGNAAYVEKVTQPPPPVVTITSIDIQLAKGSTVTTKKSDGTEKVETA